MVYNTRLDTIEEEVVAICNWNTNWDVKDSVTMGARDIDHMECSEYFEHL